MGLDVCSYGLRLSFLHTFHCIPMIPGYQCPSVPSVHWYVLLLYWNYLFSLVGPWTCSLAVCIGLQGLFMYVSAWVHLFHMGACLMGLDVCFIQGSSLISSILSLHPNDTRVTSVPLSLCPIGMFFTVLELFVFSSWSHGLLLLQSVIWTAGLYVCQCMSTFHTEHFRGIYMLDENIEHIHHQTFPNWAYGLPWHLLCWE